MVEINIAAILGIMGLALALYNALYDRFKVQIDNEKRFSKLETKIELFWTTIEKNATEFIHSPHTPDLDKLLEKAHDKSLTPEEVTHLKDDLKCLIKENGIPRAKEFASKLLIARLDALENDNLLKNKKKKK
jgi:hypothetical protein